jgi:hypothetical protein
MTAVRTDDNHASAKSALKICGFPFIDLSAVGHGCEDFLVGVISGRGTTRCGRWVMLEMKNLLGRGLRFTPAQLDWQARTLGFPRIIATSAEHAIKQLRELQRG